MRTGGAGKLRLLHILCSNAGLPEGRHRGCRSRSSSSFTASSPKPQDAPPLSAAAICAWARASSFSRRTARACAVKPGRGWGAGRLHPGDLARTTKERKQLTGVKSLEASSQMDERKQKEVCPTFTSAGSKLQAPPTARLRPQRAVAVADPP